MKKNPVDEAIGYFIHACLSGLWGEDRSELEPEVQEVLLNLEADLQGLIEKYRAGRNKPHGMITETQTGNFNTIS